MPQTRIGISGWNYAGWRGGFYPPGLGQKHELEFASRQVNSIEINGTFYSLQRPEHFQRWYETTPKDFVFAVKGSRYITHLKRLKNVDEALANFFASGVLLLREKLGPFLWQFPPQMRFEEARFADFFNLLPKTPHDLAARAKRHSAWLKPRAYTRATRTGPIRHAVEVRHPSFEDPAFYRLLKRHGFALVLADSAGKWPTLQQITADFLYLRLHGSKKLYVSGYGEPALHLWAKKIRRWQGGKRDVFVYFDNDVKVRAPFDAMSLLAKLTDHEPEVLQTWSPTFARRALLRSGLERSQWPTLKRSRRQDLDAA